MVYDKILNLITSFLIAPNEYGFCKFRDEYDDIIDLNRDSIFTEVGEYKYEILDEIYMLLEKYEDSEEIRNTDVYCINEHALVEKITVLFDLLKKECISLDDTVDSVSKECFINRVNSLVSCITFEYHGKDCGVDPFSKNNFDVWCGDILVKAESIDEVMNVRIFDGQNLNEIFNYIENIDY